MKCSELDQDILLLQHGELSPLRAFLVKHHIQGCPRCQEKRDSYRQIGRHIAATIRQDAGLPAFVFRGEQPAVPVRPQNALPAMRLRPSVAFGATALAAIIAAGAYAYRAMALTPTNDDPVRTVFVAHVNHSRTDAAKDAKGHTTIFPYSTPVMTDHECNK